MARVATVMFDDPIIAFDDPIIAFDDPIIAITSQMKSTSQLPCGGVSEVSDLFSISHAIEKTPSSPVSMKP